MNLPSILIIVHSHINYSPIVNYVDQYTVLAINVSSNFKFIDNKRYFSVIKIIDILWKCTKSISEILIDLITLNEHCSMIRDTTKK